MTRFTATTLSMLVALALYSTSAHAQPPTGVDSKLKVGMLLTLSGSFSSAGEDCRRGIEAALKEAPDMLDVVYADSKNEPATAISEFHRLVGSQHVAGIYTHRSSMGMALNPVSLKAEVPLIGAVGHKDFATGNRFAVQVWPNAEHEGRFIAEQFLARGYKRAALIYTQDEWTSSVSDAFREKYTSGKGTVAFDISVPPSEQDLRTLLLQVRSGNPDVIFVNMLLPQIAPIVRQARELGIRGKLFSNFYVAKDDVLKATSAEALEGIGFVELDSNLPELRRRVGLKDGETLQGLTVASYVSTMLLGQAAQQMGEAKSPRELHAVLGKQREVRTPDGVYPIENGYVKFPLRVKILRSGKSVDEISPESIGR